MFAPAYLDHNATTPVAPEVLEAMLPYLREQYGNPSSRHEYGRAARRAVDEAREQVAAAVGAHPTEVVFTSGGSEANNLFLKGATLVGKPGALAVSAIEHPCVIKPAEQLARAGWAVTKIAVDPLGRLCPNAYASALAAHPLLVSVMLANNETGVVQDVAALAAQARAAGAWFHTDAVQALGKMPVDFRALGVAAMTVSSHKIYGPKGAAALVLDKRVDLQPLIAGGGHERGLRSGTENVAAIVGFGHACTLAVAGLARRSEHMRTLRQALETGLVGLGATRFGAEGLDDAARLPNTSYFAFSGIDGETLVGKLDREGFACASGAACSSANPEPSHVLAAMGVDAGLARGAVRVSVGEGNTLADVERFLQTLKQTVERLKSLSTLAA
ncbi:cysteine desulfurase [Oryzomicrobium terrae]|uniref:Cysteine desulfurase n=1 Tax=Oryzomicrobium terrae TaxID=1735038 RepID=A0A5C1E7F4_9RHOO|nr:cysteine desulfurase family protein [Oryzomicrobium terrae]QEL64876.1 cysteine desulfurase [Oryzomicrobium terrae]